MKLNKGFVAVVLTALLVFSASAYAKSKQTSKVYMFGFAASFNDSTVYFTDIQEVDSVSFKNKNKFLYGREDYSYQLKNYLEGKGQPHRTCVVGYGVNLKKVEKKFTKMKNKYIKRGNFDIRTVDSSEFKFIPVKPEE